MFNFQENQMTPSSAIKKSDLTKENILQSALKLFNEKGFEQTTMRDIAKDANTALGSTYYYFQSKDEIVQQFYQDSQKILFPQADPICERHHSFEKRFVALLKIYFEFFAQNKPLYQALVSSAVSPKHKLSPFGENSNELRQNSLNVFTKLIEGSDLKLQAGLKEKAPMLFWLYYMGMLFFWAHDASQNQKRTMNLIEISLPIFVKLIKVVQLPFMKKYKAALIDLLPNL